VGASKWKDRRKKRMKARGGRATATPTTHSLRFPASGIFGEEIGFTIMPGGASSAGAPGSYSAIVILARPGRVARDEYNHQPSDRLVGDSHFAIASPALDAIGVRAGQQASLRFFAGVGAAAFEFDVLPNKHGYAERIKTKQFQAQGFDDAFSKAYRAIVPALSDLSLQLDVPLYVDHFEIREEATGGIRMTGQAPYHAAALNPNRERNLDAHLRHFSALYREAVQSNSANYRFLCFYRILEGLDDLWERRAVEMRAAGLAPSRPSWRLPDDVSTFLTHLSAVFPQRSWAGTMDFDAIFPIALRGRKLLDIQQNELKGIRDDIAHSLLQSPRSSGPGGAVGLSLDDPDQNLRVQQRIAVLRFIVRRRLRDVFPQAFDEYPPDPPLPDR
jgi:hypothetical protein